MWSPARRRAFAASLVTLLFSSSALAAPVPEAPDRYGEAQDLLEADDFVGAAEIWEALLEETPESSDTYAGREAMIINVIDARIEAYRRQVTAHGEREPLNLFAAQVALRRYLRLYGRGMQAVSGSLLFLRGVLPETGQGVLEITPPEALLNDLDGLFVSPASRVNEAPA